ncbi:TY-Chap domain-containing protein [Tomitella biformata]|uniref:TY-Chap domain-containing protein n=1 Tax=Tomitella biformata TaxID=630403 RepID=UPI0004654A0B|nr:hypothetical protein [Tomitella biformata]
MPEQTFDELTDRTWSRFTDDLAGYLRQMQAGDILILESHYDGAVDPESTGGDAGRARVRLTARPDDGYRVEVPRNDFLNPLRTLDGLAHRALAQLGFHKPDQCSHEDPAPGHDGSESYYADGAPDAIAQIAAVVFRLTWSVPDPAFLRGRAAGREDVPEFDAWGPEIDEDAPESALQIAVEAAVVEMFGENPAIDDEGVITLSYGESHVHLRVDEHTDHVDVYAGILDLAEADSEDEYDLTREVLDAIPSLNLQWPSVKWHISEQTLLGVIRVDGAPFMPPHLTRALEAMGALLDSADDILTELTSDAEASGHPGGQALLNYSRPAGARSVLEAEHAWDGSAAAADTIVAVLRLNTGATSGLADDEVADLCEGDVDLVLECLRMAKAELAFWQSEDADTAMRAEEQRGWAVVIDKLLGAIASLSQSGR